MTFEQVEKGKSAIIGCPSCFNLNVVAPKCVEFICEKCGAKLVRCDDKTLEPLSNKP